MAAGFDALGDEEVTSGAGGSPCLFRGPDLPGDQRATVVAELDEFWIRVAVEELDHPDERRHCRDGVRVEEREEKAGPDRLLGRAAARAGAECIYQRGPVEVARADHAEPP